MAIIRNRVSARSINDQDEILPVHQVYCWLLTTANNIIIVSKDWLQRQLPWGKPEHDETYLETLKREVYEETGIDIENIIHSAQFFWYYTIDENWIMYLQLRYALRLWTSIDYDTLNPNEKDDIKFIKTIALDDIWNYLPRLPMSGEYTSFTKMQEL